ncbi:hypothetical protein FOMPIDRAFT_1079638, partial [Fomitopsis schrenkii]
LIKALFKNLSDWEDDGWIGVRGATYKMALVNQLRQRCAPTTFRKAASEEEKEIITISKKARDDALHNGPPTVLQPIEKKAFKLSGAKLSCMTQALAYKGIRERAAPPPRMATTIMIDTIQEHLRAIPDADWDESDIWRGIKNKDLRRPVTDFLWKGIHEAHRIGKFWMKIPGHEDRARCTHCHEQDSLGHILLECSATGQASVWKLARAAWRRKEIDWIPLHLLDILAIGPRSRALVLGKPTPGHLSRFWRILVSESAHLVWKLRCERVIGHSDDNRWQHTEASVTTRWTGAINARLRQDVMGTSNKYGRLSLKKGQVLRTWQHTLENEDRLPADW